MSGQAAVYGRLGTDPVQRTTGDGKPWTSASIAVNLDASGQPGATPAWFGVVYFGKVAETMCRYSKGDIVIVSGRLQMARWKDGTGKDREQLRIVADTVISAKSIRPAGGRPRLVAGGAA